MSLGTSRRTKFEELSSSHPKNLWNKTETTPTSDEWQSGPELSKDIIRRRHLGAWKVDCIGFPPVMKWRVDEGGSSNKNYDRGKSPKNCCDICQLAWYCEMMTTPEGKCFNQRATFWDFKKRPVSRRVGLNGKRDGGARHVVAASDVASCFWVSHRKHGRWRTTGLVVQECVHGWTGPASRQNHPKLKLLQLPVST